MSIFEKSVTCRFFQELYSHIDKNSGGNLRICFSSKQQIREPHQNDFASFDERFYDNLFSERNLILLVHNCCKVIM